MFMSNYRTFSSSFISDLNANRITTSIPHILVQWEVHRHNEGGEGNLVSTPFGLFSVALEGRNKDFFDCFGVGGIVPVHREGTLTQLGGHRLARRLETPVFLLAVCGAGQEPVLAG